jgi:hypothetical protein
VRGWHDGPVGRVLFDARPARGEERELGGDEEAVGGQKCR